MAEKIVWWTVVGFGPCLGDLAVYKSREEAVEAKEKWAGKDSSGWTGANTRVYGYRTRQKAREANIADDIGQCGRVA